jgi:hypothetical protein
MKRRHFQARRPDQRCALVLEPLEGRELPSVCLVDSLGDTGRGRVPLESQWGPASGDLRFCVNRANTLAGSDTIQFAVTGTINLKHALPDLASDIDIQGPGADVLTVRRSTGGNYRVLTVAAGTVQVSGLTVSNGNADAGGGIYNQSTLTLDNLAVSSNTAGSQGGGIYNAGELTISNATVTGNQNLSTTPYGGGIYNVGTLAVDHSTISGNTASGYGPGGANGYGLGGGLANDGSVTIDQSQITGNTASASSYDKGSIAEGGGICNRGSLTVTRTVVSANSATVPHKLSDIANGGGIFNQGVLTLDSSTVSANVAGGTPNSAAGGGIWSSSPGTLTVVNSTIAGNKAQGSTCAQCQAASGGGIYGAAVTVRSSTIAGNSCTGPSQFGGGVFNAGAGASLSNTVVAGNQAATGPDVSGTLASSAYDLFGKSAGGSGYGSSDLLDVDPLLGPLQDNGGPTQTMALLPGSPAIDSGDNTNAPDWDQRGTGYPRVVNGTIDRGAFEVQSAAPGFGGRAMDFGSPASAPAPIHDAAVRYLMPAAPAPNVVDDSSRQSAPGAYATNRTDASRRVQDISMTAEMVGPLTADLFALP